MISYRYLILLLVLLAVAVPVTFAADLGDIVPTEKEVTSVIVYEGSKTISDSLTSKSTMEKSSILAAYTDAVLKDEKYPYAVVGTEITILKYRCTPEMCGYWILATRGGKEVATNSPIWISPPPYLAVVSDVMDTKNNIQTITLKEDPKTAVELVLRDYVDHQPLGKAVTGTES